jgi:hypothetical protein
MAARLGEEGLVAYVDAIEVAKRDGSARQLARLGH